MKAIGVLDSRRGIDQEPELVPPTGQLRRHRIRRIGLASFGVLVVLAVIYRGVIRPWQHHWGATAEEVARTMPGDELVPNPLQVTTRAVTVSASPEYIWPWLLQIGNNRGGLYSCDWIDLLIGALDQPSADRVLPEFQNLQVGDTVAYAKGTDFVIRVLEPNRAFVYQFQQGDVNIVQSWGLYPVDAGHTRLVLRVLQGAKLTPQLVPVLLVLDPAEGIMTSKQLLGIKQRAEALQTSSPAPATHVATGWTVREQRRAMSPLCY